MEQQWSSDGLPEVVISTSVCERENKTESEQRIRERECVMEGDSATMWKDERASEWLSDMKNIDHHHHVISIPIIIINRNYLPVMGQQWSSSVCQLISHPEANKKGEWVNSASYKKCKELCLKDTTRLKSFPTLPMYRDTAGNAVTYDATNKPEETSKSGRKRVLFSDKTNDKDRSRSDYSKRPRDDA